VTPARMSILLAALVAEVRAESPDPRARAKEHFEHAEAHYQAEAYDRAISEYLEAYRLVAEPELLFNVAQAYRRQGDRPRAVEYFEKYLAVAPDGRVAARARALLGEVKLEMKRDEAPQAAAKAPPAPEPASYEATLARRVPPTPASKGRWLKWAGIGAGAAGVATLAAGVYFGVQAKRLSEETTDGTGPWTTDNDRKVDEAERDETRMFVLLGVGGGVLAAGGVLYYLGSRADARAVAIAPAATPSTAGLVAVGSF